MKLTLAQLVDQTTNDATGALRWKSNGNGVPADILAAAGVHPHHIEATEAAREADLRALVAQLRVQEQEESEDQRAERLFELRAAFGPGETIVNAFTGTVTKT